MTDSDKDRINAAWSELKRMDLIQARWGSCANARQVADLIIKAMDGADDKATVVERILEDWFYSIQSIFSS